MPTPHRTVVVTGMGATTPVGGDVPTTWDALLAGRSGIALLTQDWAAELPARLAGTMAVDPTTVLERTEARRWDRTEQAAIVAWREAWRDAGSPQVESERLGVVVGTGIGGVTSLLAQYDLLRERGASRVSPMTVPMLMPNGAAAWVGLEAQARAGVHTPVSACASGAEAVLVAARMIRDGRADVVVAGGTEACVHPLTLAAFASMRALSTRHDEPTRASRPYDTGRDGFVMGEGAAVIVLESEEHARARGARIYAELAAAGMSSDAHHITAPEPEGAGASRAMREAVERAGLTPADIVHINAHATSTPVGDVAESNAIRRAFGDATDGMCVSGTKSMTGHLLGAAGALEGLFTILSVHHRIAPATINIEDLDPAIHLDVVRGEHRTLPGGDIAALNNSFGFGGHNVALTVKSI